MPSIIEGYNYDIFISYRQKDNKGDRWVSEFVDSLKTELESTFKEEISVYFDINPHDGLLETHDVDESLKEKLKCLVFIPIISRTYCDPKSFAWEYEFKAFVNIASKDRFGLKIKLPGGNVAGRVLPVRIHDLDLADIKECELILGGFLRGVEFIYKEPGVNRQLTPKDNEEKNLNHTNYRNQINKVALAIRDLIESIRIPILHEQVTDKNTRADIAERLGNIKSPEVKKHNLPISTTSFIGREKEIKEVRDLFQKSRIITLTGAGGCGKTRLAKEIALTLVEEYKDGVWFVNLSPITNPDFIAKSISEVLSISEEPDKLIIETLINKIKDKSLLILLDNCEHLIQACAEIVDKLLQSAQDIRILATSREALNISGEVMWRIPSLSFPTPVSRAVINEIDRYESIKLFTDRAALGKSGFTVNTQNVSIVAQICSRVEGIPLAIELAATRIRHMGPETILERLKDQFNILSSSDRIAPERHQTLKATIDWSYKLLSEQEQLLFNRLAIFTDDFSLEGAEEVCQDDKLPKENILSHLSQLVDKSLIIINTQVDGEVRYRFLEPIHQYSLQKLIDNKEEESLRKNHLDYYLKMAEKAYKEQFDGMAGWITKLDMEHNNLRTALDWADDHSLNDYRRLCGSLGWFWNTHGYYSLGKIYLTRSLEKIRDRTRVTARLLLGLGNNISYSEGYRKGNELLYESLNIFREIGDEEEQSIVLYNLSMIGYGQGNIDLGLNYSEEGVKLAEVAGNKALAVQCSMMVCQGLVCTLQIDRAKKLAEQLLEISKEQNHTFGMIVPYHFLGDCAILSGNFLEAEGTYAQNISRCYKSGFILGAVIEMQGTAMSVAGQSRYSKAVRLNAATMEKAILLGIKIPGYKFWQDLLKKHISPLRTIIGEELYNMYEEEGKKMGFEAAIEYALDFDKD